MSADIKRRLAVMSAVHGEWVRREFKAGNLGRIPHCDCSRCMLVGP